MGLDVRVEAVTTHMTDAGEKPIDHDADPTVVLVHYPSIFASSHSYVKPVVKVEISCLSMREPFEVKRIASLISEGFATEDDEAVTEIVRDTVYIEKRDSVFVQNTGGFDGLTTGLANPTNKKNTFVSSLKWITALVCAVVVLIITIKVCLLRR